jgi:nitroimidazol reductase NimA-like FMN-containing flavoprotein (pyridoxamine 5'-phosphate oxidase superfamily)
MKHIDEPILGAEFNRPPHAAAPNPGLASRIRRLVEGQPFCVLCTQGARQPYGSLIAYAFTDDLRSYFFATQVATRKFKLLSECQHVALLIDSRCQHPDDMTQVDAVTITGRATELEAGPERREAVGRLRDRHPYLAGFLEAASTAVFQVDVVRYLHVTRFQEVSQWIP